MDRIEVCDHHGQRLLVTVLAAAELSHGIRTLRVTSKMKPAQSLDPDDLAATERDHGRGERIGIAAQNAGSVEECQSRPAGWACDTLSMETAVSRIVVFALALAGRVGTRPSLSVRGRTGAR